MSGGKNVFEPRKEIETDVFSPLVASLGQRRKLCISMRN